MMLSRSEMAAMAEEKWSMGWIPRDEPVYHDKVPYKA